MNYLEDAYLRANINLADTLAEALVSVNEGENKPEKKKKKSEQSAIPPVDPEGRMEKEAERLFAQRRKSRAAAEAADARQRRKAKYYNDPDKL